LLLNICECTNVLSDGEIIADHPTLQIFNDEALLVQAHLEKPMRMQGTLLVLSSNGPDM